MVMDRYITMVKREHISMIIDRKINWQYYYKIKKHYRILRGSALNDCDVYLKTVTICFVFYVIILGISSAFPCVPLRCVLRYTVPRPLYCSILSLVRFSVFTLCYSRLFFMQSARYPVHSPCLTRAFPVRSLIS